jgi:hypothetical protein
VIVISSTLRRDERIAITIGFHHLTQVSDYSLVCFMVLFFLHYSLIRTKNSSCEGSSMGINHSNKFLFEESRDWCRLTSPGKLTFVNNRIMFVKFKKKLKFFRY